MTVSLFVYVSFGPGKEYEHVLTAIGGSWQEATVRGFRRSQGWGAAMGYPGFVVDETGDEVQGHLFISDDLPAHWEELDAFEGEEYERVPVKAHTREHGIVDAYVYALRTR